MATVLQILLFVVGLFLMFVVLLQRGRGGGLAGALGGMGGQSAFGTKAGDVFTKITIVLAVVWVVLACFAGAAIRSEAGAKARRFDEVKQPVLDAPKSEKEKAEEKTKAADKANEKSEKSESKSEKSDSTEKKSETPGSSEKKTEKTEEKKDQ